MTGRRWIISNLSLIPHCVGSDGPSIGKRFLETADFDGLMVYPICGWENSPGQLEPSDIAYFATAKQCGRPIRLLNLLAETLRSMFGFNRLFQDELNNLRLLQLFGTNDDHNVRLQRLGNFVKILPLSDLPPLMLHRPVTIVTDYFPIRTTAHAALTFEQFACWPAGIVLDTCYLIGTEDWQSKLSIIGHNIEAILLRGTNDEGDPLPDLESNSEMCRLLRQLSVATEHSACPVIVETGPLEMNFPDLCEHFRQIKSLGSQYF